MELTIFGSGLTVTTSTSAVVFDPFANVWADSSEIFWTMLDLFSPVPAAAAPAFWTKKTSSVSGYLLHCQKLVVGAENFETDQTTASWKIGSSSLVAITWRVGSDPRMSRNAGS